MTRVISVPRGDGFFMIFFPFTVSVAPRAAPPAGRSIASRRTKSVMSRISEGMMTSLLEGRRVNRAF